MTGATHGRPFAVELTSDRRFERRVRRLAAIASVALGLIWALATVSLDAPIAIGAALAVGWLLMPTLLAASLTHPRLRYGLIVPASLVTVGLLAISAGWLPDGPVAAAGWVVMTAGIAVGAGLGLWFWYRVVPVPSALDDPFAGGRWMLIGLHAVLVVTGFALAATALLAR